MRTSISANSILKGVKHNIAIRVGENLWVLPNGRCVKMLIYKLIPHDVVLYALYCLTGKGYGTAHQKSMLNKAYSIQ